MKTSELAGAQLDYWVAKAEDEYPAFIKDRQCWLEIDSDHTVLFAPHRDWEQAGEIIERERIGVEHGPTEARHGLPHPEGLPPWHAYITLQSGGRRFAFADSPLVAAMRAFVASKFGAEVPEIAP